ncbi:MAG TPA: GNAT family N-acetyltransferase [Patescibacteria group bacterium]|nr:GNAT family N-acetyltransferase [Patescibacteria group bacterium]
MQISKLTKELFPEAVELVLRAELDTREEIEHHLQHVDAHFVAIENDKVIGVIGWYQDTVHYADAAMGDKFPGEDAYWVGFFAVDKEHQGHGIGSALIKQLEEVVKSMGADTLWVSSVPETKSYYESKGFSLVCEGEIRGNQKYFFSKSI